MNSAEAAQQRLIGFQRGAEWGYISGLSAAIYAVKKVPDDRNSSTEWERDYEADTSGETRNPRIWVREAVTAIETLAGDSL